MPTSLYEISFPVVLRALTNLSLLLEKGRAFADANGISHSELLEARLAPDMAPLTAQIQRVSDTSKGLAVRIGHAETVAMEDKETTFDDLHARIAATRLLVESVSPDDVNGREDDEVIVKLPSGSLTFTARAYVLDFALPNLFFHVTTAYALLRHKGVPIGKMDFLGGF